MAIPGQPAEGERSLRRLHALSLVCCALTLAPALAHGLEMPAKMGLGASDYQLVQQLYRGWAWFAVPVLLGLGWTGRLAWRTGARLAWLAFVCLLGAQGVFWTFTFPANQATANWTVLPADWQGWRTDWEYSHAAGAVLNLVALAALAAVRPRSTPGRS